MAASAWRSALVMAMLLTTGNNVRAQNQAWTIVPSVGLRGTYTDNASLAVAPQHGDFITDVTGALSISGQGPRFRASLNYIGDALFYSQTRDQDRVINQLRALANFEAIEKFFFVDAAANISQSFISPFAARPADIATVTPNRIETRTVSVSPYIRRQTSGGYAFELRNRNTWTYGDVSTLDDVHTVEWNGSVTSPISLFGWGADANDTNIDYQNPLRPERESRIARGRLFFQPDPTLRLSASAGKEENNFIQQEMRSVPIYGYGAQWTPTPLTSAQFNWERRFFGPSPVASFDHRPRSTAWRVSYSKTTSSYQQQLLGLPPGDTTALLDQIFRGQISDPVQRQAAIEQFMRANGIPTFLSNSLAFYTEQIFLDERLEGTFMVLGVRNSIGLNVFASNRTAVTSPPPGLPAEIFVALRSHIKQHGFGANASHRLSGFTSVNITANRIFADAEETAVQSRSDFITGALNHSVSRKTDTFAGVTYQRFDSSLAPTAHTRSVYAGFVHRF